MSRKFMKCLYDLFPQQGTCIAYKGCHPLAIWSPFFRWSSTCLLSQKVPHRTADITLIAGILCLNTVLQILQSKWTALHILFFSNSVIMVPKLTHITSHNLVPWTLRTLTEHWTRTLRSYQEHYEPYQNFLTAVCFPGFLFLLNVSHAPSQ